MSWMHQSPERCIMQPVKLIDGTQTSSAQLNNSELWCRNAFGERLHAKFHTGSGRISETADEAKQIRELEGIKTNHMATEKGIIENTTRIRRLLH